MMIGILKRRSIGSLRGFIPKNDSTHRANVGEDGLGARRWRGRAR